MKSKPCYTTLREEEKNVELKTWKEFREQGFLWLVNSILHVFGWTIIVEEKISDPEQIVANVYRTKFRGFPEETNTKNYALIAEYMKNNADVLYDEATKG